jgi:hypothetical protein
MVQCLQQRLALRTVEASGCMEQAGGDSHAETYC